MVTALTVSAVFVCAGALFSDRRWGAALAFAGLLTAFTGLAIGVHTHGWVTAFDAPAASWIDAGRHRSHRLDVASSMIARIGNQPRSQQPDWPAERSCPGGLVQRSRASS